MLRIVYRASLVAQWLRIRLPMQGTRVRSVVWEDPTCRGVTKPVHHNYWACALEPMSHNYWAHVPQLLKPARLEPVLLKVWKPSLTFAHLLNSFSLLQFWMLTLPGRIFLAVSSSLSAVWIYHASPFQSVKFLLKNQLIVLWGFPCHK